MSAKKKTEDEMLRLLRRRYGAEQGNGQEPLGYGLCSCGCGEKTSIAKMTNRRIGHVQGKPVMWKLGHKGRKLVRYVMTPGPLDTMCHIWALYKDSDGYGQQGIKGRHTKAHIFAWEGRNGPVPDGLQLDHLCRNRACVNPDHLEAVTCKENVHRGVGPTAINARKTHCKRGHPLYGDNLYVFPSGSRACRICKNASTAAYNQRKQSNVS